MSNKLAKAERSKVKDARQIPAPDARTRRRSNPRNKKERVWAVEMQGREFKRVKGGWIMTGEPDRIYLPWGKYRTKEIAQEVVDLQNRKYGGNDFRIRPLSMNRKTAELIDKTNPEWTDEMFERATSLDDSDLPDEFKTETQHDLRGTQTPPPTPEA